MKIKTKLIIAFCIIIFVPILLATATVVGFCNFQAHAIEETYGIKNTDAYSVINSVQLLNRYTVADFQKIQKKIQKNADELVNMTYLQELNEELKQKYSYLIIRRGSQLYYNGGSDNQIVVDFLERSCYVGRCDCVVKRIVHHFGVFGDNNSDGVVAYF